MRTIWKTEIELKDGYQQFKMPQANPVSVGWQNGKPVVWWQIMESENDPVSQHVIVLGTGHALKYGGEYIGTVQDPDQPLVWHLFWKEGK